MFARPAPLPNNNSFEPDLTSDGLATTNIDTPAVKSSNPEPKLKKSSTPSKRTDGTPPTPDDTNIGRAEPELDAFAPTPDPSNQVDTEAPSPNDNADASSDSTSPSSGTPMGGPGTVMGVADTVVDTADSPPAPVAVTR